MKIKDSCLLSISVPPIWSMHSEKKSWAVAVGILLVLLLSLLHGAATPIQNTLKWSFHSGRAGIALSSEERHLPLTPNKIPVDSPLWVPPHHMQDKSKHAVRGRSSTDRWLLHEDMFEGKATKANILKHLPHEDWMPPFSSTRNQGASCCRCKACMLGTWSDHILSKEFWMVQLFMVIISMCSLLALGNYYYYSESFLAHVVIRDSPRDEKVYEQMAGLAWLGLVVKEMNQRAQTSSIN